MRRAKVFFHGRNQAIHLPKDFRVATDEVFLKKIPGGFAVLTRDPWDIFYEGIHELPEQFMASGRRQLERQSRD